MTAAELQYDPLRDYAEQYCDGTLSARETALLEQRLRDDPQAMEFFVLYMEIHSQIVWDSRARSEESGKGPDTSARGLGTSARGLGTSVPSTVVGGQWPEPVVSGQWPVASEYPLVGAAVELPHQPGVQHSSNPQSPIPNPSLSPVPFIVVDDTLLSPLSSLPSFLFSYTVATIIFGLAGLAGWFYQVEHYTEFARSFGTSPAAVEQPKLPAAEKTTPVARVTGLVDCQWSEPATEAFNGSHISQGRRFALASGLMQLTYDSGAKVILQGPCTYQVDSAAGGFLSLGKLTAKVASGQWPVASAKPQAAAIHHSSLSIHHSEHPSLSTTHYPLFTIKTPTATVTDLGTEFGVEVSHDGAVATAVFQGMVSLTIPAERGYGGEPQVLKAGQTARVFIDGRTPRIDVAVAKDHRFVRCLSVLNSEVLIGPEVCNGSFEDPPVGPDRFDPDAGNMTIGVYAIIHNVVPKYWNPTSSIQTKGSFVRGVTGQQYVVLQDPLPRLAIQFDGAEGRPAVRHYEPHTIYTLTADLGSNVAGLEAVVAFECGELQVRRAVVVDKPNLMQAMPPFELDTVRDRQFIGKPITISFTRRDGRDQIYVDNVRLTAARRVPAAADSVATLGGGDSGGLATKKQTIEKPAGVVPSKGDSAKNAIGSGVRSEKP